VAALKATVPTISDVIVYDEASDPNSLLGRPGQYVSKAGFHDSRLAGQESLDDAPFAVVKGGDVEVWSTDQGAQERADYVGGIVNSPAGAIFGPEYMYRIGPVLLRVSGKLTPPQASEYDRALASVLN
jgi:hypothetical protein